MDLPFDPEAFDILTRWQRGVASFVGLFDILYGSKEQLDQLRSRVQNDKVTPIKYKKAVYSRSRPGGPLVRRVSTQHDERRGDAPLLYGDDEESHLVKLSKRAATQCSGVGLHANFTGTLYNCSGTIETLNSMRNATEKRATLTPCSQCTAGNATCTATCCSVLTTNATYHCTCPIDRLGKDCESPRPYTCTLHPLHPHMNCTSLSHAPMPLSSSDAQSKCAATQLSLTSPPSSVIASYHINCTFTIRPNINLTTYPSSSAGPSRGPGSIQTWARRADEFAWTDPVDPVIVLEQRVIHWYSMFSGSISDFVWLSREQLMGTRSIEVAVNLTRVTQETALVRMNGRMVRKRAFVVGGRVYLEADIGSSMWGRTGPVPAAHGFLDFVDVPDAAFEQVRVTRMLRTGKDEGIVASIAVLVLIGVLAMLAIACLCRRVVKPPKKVE